MPASIAFTSCGTNGNQIAAYVAFYPDCATTYRDDAQLVGKPVRLFHGAPDDYNPVAPCKAFVRASRPRKSMSS